MGAVLKASSAFLRTRFLQLVQSFQSVFQTPSSQVFLQQRREILLQTVILAQGKPNGNSPFTTHVLTWQKRAFPFVDRDALLTMTVYRCMFSQVVVVHLGKQYFYIAPSSRFSRLLTYLKLQPAREGIAQHQPQPQAQFEGQSDVQTQHQPETQFQHQSQQQPQAQSQTQAQFEGQSEVQTQHQPETQFQYQSQQQPQAQSQSHPSTNVQIETPGTWSNHENMFRRYLAQIGGDFGRVRPQFFFIGFWQFRNNQQRRLAYFIRHAMVCAE